MKVGRELLLILPDHGGVGRGEDPPVAHHAGPVVLVHKTVCNSVVIIVNHVHLHTGVEIFEHLDDNESRSDSSDEHK